MLDETFWSGKRVFLTGHTGFKGSWLALWLHRLGATVCGYALAPPTNPNLYAAAGVGALLQSIHGDVRDAAALQAALREARPEIVFHLAAQPLVRESYRDPVATFATNVMGTVNLLEAVRHSPEVRAVVNVTTDKCYENREWLWGYRENEALGGHDPYSSSKGCAELVTAAYRNSFFSAPGGGEGQSQPLCRHAAAVATARAGNVIGGGDWAADRLLPDLLRAMDEQRTVRIRAPRAIRPWQHVLEPLGGYLLLAERLGRDGGQYAGAWNFGPADEDARDVRWIVDYLAGRGKGFSWELDATPQPHEAGFLKLDSSKARTLLGWAPRYTLEQALAEVLAWHAAYRRGDDLRAVTLAQIDAYLAAGEGR